MRSVWHRFPAAGFDDAAGARRAHHREHAGFEAALCHRSHLHRRRDPDPARRHEPDRPRYSTAHPLRGVDRRREADREEEGRR